MWNEEQPTDKGRIYRHNTGQWIKKALLMLGAAFFILYASFSISSCARMGTPDGGWYDDTPPYVVNSSPADKAAGVKSHKVTINFNEFVKLEDAQSKVIVSPPQLEMADIKASGRRIIIDLKDTLKENTTYTIDFSDAISDNTEGNPMGNYTFSFSTGPAIDTMEISGYALNAENLEPVKGILVGLYPANDSAWADSTFHTKPFVRVARTNGSGRFAIKGVAPGNYYCYALQDADGDFVYGQKSEMIGFSHEVYIPTSKPDIRQDTVWADSLHISNILRTGYTHFLPDDVTLLCFTAPQTDRYLVKTERTEPEKLGFYFSYGSDSLPRIRGLNFEADSAFVLEASEKRDTLFYWLRDTALVNQDTLRYELTFLMTDSAGMLVEKTDTLEALAKVPYAKRLKQLEKELEDWQKEQEKKKKRNEHYDSIRPPKKLDLKINPRGSLAPNQNILFEMPAPLAECDTAAIHLYSKIDSLWYESPHRWEQLSTRTYRLKGEWRPGVEYSLEIDSAAFRSIYGLVSHPIKQGIKVRTEDEFSTLMVSVSGAGADTAAVVVQLLDNGDKVVEEKALEDGTADFYYLKPGKYYLRAFFDLNGNGIWDTGDYDKGLHAEPVYYHNEAVECKAKWDVSRNWRLDALPRYQQKPLAITKQKPDKEKQLKNRNVQRALDKGIQYLPNGMRPNTSAK